MSCESSFSVKIQSLKQIFENKLRCASLNAECYAVGEPLHESIKMKITETIWVAIIGVIGTGLVAFIQKCGTDSPAVVAPTPPPPLPSPMPQPPPPSPPSNKDWDGEDLEGKSKDHSVKVRVVYKVIVDQFRWKLGSHELLENEKPLYTVLPPYLENLPDFQNAIGIISVGVSSEEGERSPEENRASRRAEQISLAVNPHKIALNKNTYRLNLGQHTKSGTTVSDKKIRDETSYQRKIILIGVMSWSGNMPEEEMENCLKDALTHSQRLSFDVKNYSKFELTINKLDYQKKTFQH